MEKILKKNISSLNNKAVYRIPSDDKSHVYGIEISDEMPNNYKTFIPNKFNNKNEYTTDKNSAPFTLLNSQDFPEKNTCDECVLTNDGILAFRYSNNDVVIYDLLHEDSKTFDEITSEVRSVNILQLKEIDKQSMLAYHYLLSFDNKGFLPIKISNNLFYMDCEEINGYTKTDDGYFSGETCPEHINTVKIKNKLIYNVKFYNGKTKDDLSDSSIFIENNVIDGGNGESTELTLKSNSTDTIVIELW